MISCLECKVHTVLKARSTFDSKILLARIDVHEPFSEVE